MPSYPAPDASSLVTAGIAGLALVMAVIWLVLLGRAATPEHRRRTVIVGAIVGVGWLTLTAVLASRGVLARFDALPPPFMLVLVGVLVLGLGLGLSPVGRRVATLPIALLVGVHAFRLPLELVMSRAAAEGVMPVEMSFHGYNFDIVTGVSAIAVAIAASRNAMPRWGLWLWNLVGLALLLTVMTIALLGSPMIRAFGEAPEHVVSWVAYPPFVWLPAVLVAFALFGHVVVWRNLLASAR